jgi:hypothetical protein
MSEAGILASGVLASLDTAAQMSISASYDAETDKQHIINLLAAAGEHEQVVKVRRCCSEFRALGCANGHLHKPVPVYRCRYRLCIDCARERASRAYRRLFPILEAFGRAYPRDRAVMITLTVKSSFEPLGVHDKRFKAWFKRLRRSQLWKRSIRGALSGFEFTWNPSQGWHYHVHILAFRKQWFEQAELAAAWQKITGGAGLIVDVQSKGSMREMTKEVLKYCFKPAELTRWDVPQIREFNALRGVRLGECYGDLRGLKVEDREDETDDAAVDSEPLGIGSPCPCCGEPLHIVTVPRSSVVESPARVKLGHRKRE